MEMLTSELGMIESFAVALFLWDSHFLNEMAAAFFLIKFSLSLLYVPRIELVKFS